MTGSAEHAVPIVSDYDQRLEGGRTGAATIFVDRDGVINVNRSDHVKSWDEFQFVPRALSGLALLTRAGYRVIVLTNQASVNRGIVTEAQLRVLHDAMVQAIAAEGAQVEVVLTCPHRPDEGCSCRKPAPGLLFEARHRFSVDLQHAILVGDHPDDLEASRRAGCRSILVLSGRTPAVDSVQIPSNCIAVVSDLCAAAEYIVGQAAGTKVNPNSAALGTNLAKAGPLVTGMER